MRIETRNNGVGSMGKDSQRPFSANLLTLQLQLKTLLEDSGGKNVANLLDSLCELSGAEQEIVLNIFNKIIARISCGDVRLNSENDIKMKEFEQRLYDDIMKSIQQAAAAPASSLKLEVLDGGKQSKVANDSFSKRGEVLDLEQFRRIRKGADKPIIN